MLNMHCGRNYVGAVVDLADQPTRRSAVSCLQQVLISRVAPCRTQRLR